MISSLIKQIMVAHGLKQSELAEALGITLDRVKSLTSGKVKKLAPEESKILVEKLHVRPAFLTTGRGPALRTKEEAQFEERLGIIREATGTATSMPMPGDYQELVRDVLVGTALRNSEIVRESIDLFLLNRVASRLLPQHDDDEPPPQKKPATRKARK